MSASSARRAALDALCATAFDGTRLDDALARALASIDQRKERALARALAYGVCRYWHTLGAVRDALLTRALRARDRELGVILMLGLHQALQLRVPAHAAVNESVELAKSRNFGHAAGLVNAVLRRAIREHPVFDPATLSNDEARYAHPAWLLDAWRTAWPDDWRAIAAAGNQQPPMVLRVNPSHASRDEYLSALSDAGIGARAPAPALARLLSHAVVLEDAEDVAALPGFADGAVSVQDLAAQLAAPLLAPQPGDRVLDACAAPGGKTAHLLELQPRLELLTAVERDAQRIRTLLDGLARLGLAERAEIVCADARSLAARFPSQSFDRILIDAPCSATGVIRRHPDIKIRRTEEQIERASALQLELLEALWPLLARGGALMYATCSVMPAENRDVVATFLARCRDAKPAVIELPVGRPLGAGHQVLPGDSGMDGFFYALLHKS